MASKPYQLILILNIQIFSFISFIIHWFIFVTRATERERDRICTRDKCSNCCKSFAAFLFSTIGLVIMVAAYSIAGGFLFQMIEEGHEKENIKAGRVIVNTSTENHVNELWKITKKLNILYRDNWTAEANIVFNRYQVRYSHS